MAREAVPWSWQTGGPITLASDSSVAAGDGIVTEPCRYVVACFIPTGIDPDVYLAAAQAAQGRPPELPADSGPHFVNGMCGEFIVA
jgi:hypothetical protein